MNPLDWQDAIRRLRRCSDPNHQSSANNSEEDAPGSNSDWDAYCEYSRYSVAEAQSSTGEDGGWKALGPPSRDLYTKVPEHGGPDGEPLEMDEEDPELSRKREELRAIEEQIMRKKFEIALKKVEPFVKKMMLPGCALNEDPTPRKGTTLKDRVNDILLQRRPVGFLSKVQSPKERMNSSSLSKGCLLLEDHPLKLRVKALMKQRHSDPYVLPTKEVPDATLPPPSQSATSPTKEENGANQGFQRFLSILNKGVDMDLLSRIVNDGSEDLPLDEALLNIQPPAVQSKPDVPFRSESQQSNLGASPPGCSRVNSGERGTGPPSPERSLNERLSVPDEEEEEGGEKNNDMGGSCFGSSRQSKSPPAQKKMKKKKEEENPKLDEQREHLQNILKTLGLSLEVEEMSRLADRTQERLYGKKHEGRRADSRGEQESEQVGPHRHYRDSSFSSSSSSNSNSTGISPSPSRAQLFRNKDLKRKRTCERSRSGDLSMDVVTCKDRNRDSEDAQRQGDRDRVTKDSKEPFTYQHLYPQNQMYLHLHPAAFAQFPNDAFSLHSQDFACHNGSSSTTGSYWTYTQGARPSSLYPSRYPYPQDTCNHFPGSVGAPIGYSHRSPLEDDNLFMNPDLSKSEGQVGAISGPRCLQVINTMSQTTHCIKQLTRGSNRKRKSRSFRKHNLLQTKKTMAKIRREKSAAKLKAAQNNAGDAKTEQPEEEKRQPTEEDIKVNLRKKLAAFNQKVKDKVTQPANSITSHTG